MISKAVEFFTLRSSLFTYLVADTGNLGTQRIEAMLDILVTTVYLSDILDTAGTVGTHGSTQQGDTGTDIRTRHPASTQLDFMVLTYHHGTMRIAEDDLCTHIYQLIYEEETALEHLLMEKHTSASLGCHYEEH